MRTKRDRIISRSIVKYMVQAVRGNPTKTQVGNLNRLFAQRHLLHFDYSPIPVAILSTD